MRTRVLTIHPKFPELDKIAECAQIIREGGLVIFPTETVYGVAADANNEKAVKRLSDVKRRCANKPFSILMNGKDGADNLAVIKDYHTYKVIDDFWPGPLTLVLNSKKEGQTIGLRVPQNIIALFLSREAQRPLAAPSANVEGRPAPGTCEEALRDLDGSVDIAIDGGPASLQQASTVVDLSQEKPALLREGPVSLSQIEESLKRKHVVFVCTGNSCRSVMAEYLLRQALKGRKDVAVTSAGTSVFVSMRASSETIQILKREGADAKEHQSRPVHSMMIKKADLIITMTRAHRQYVLDKFPGVNQRVFLLKEFTSRPSASEAEWDVPDPIGQSLGVYEECLTIVKEAIQKIAKLI